MSEAPGVILVAVKPQLMDAVFPTVARLAGPDTLTISIAAGRTLASFERHLPTRAAVVRAMPNTPAAIGRGITACTPNAHVTADGRAACEALMAAVGEVVWVNNEAAMDAVTAVSGSGPAYVFLLAECLEKAAIAAGLDPELSRRLARATVAGSGELAGPLGPRCGQAARERNLAQWHHGRGPIGADGGRWPRGSAEKSRAGWRGRSRELAK